MKSETHLAFVRQLPCLICADWVSTEAAHVRFGDPRAAKPITGIGIKPDDAFVLPLCNEHHREQHSMGERNFWKACGIDPVFICLALWRVSGDYEAGAQIVRFAREKLT